MSEHPPDSAGETVDAFYRGRVQLIQSKKGFRFAIDAPLLADFVETRPEDELCELGTGNGVIAVLLSLKPWKHLTAVEIQPSLADLARRNVALNGLESRIEIVEADFRIWRPGRRFDIVLSNPPYIRKRTGFLSASAEKSIAKHEIACDIGEVMRAAAALLNPDGRAFFVYPAPRENDLRAAIAAAGLNPRTIRRVLPRPGAPPVLILVEAGICGEAPKDSPAERVMAPLILRDELGADTPEAQQIYEGRQS